MNYLMCNCVPGRFSVGNTVACSVLSGFIVDFGVVTPVILSRLNYT